MVTRTAACHCGALQLICEGEPTMVVMCHCGQCQRRTGTSYSLGAWYHKKSVTLSGMDKVFQRSGDLGMKLSYHFCPECGSTVYWEEATMANLLGVAAGCFADPKFPVPTLSTYTQDQHHWLTLPREINSHQHAYAAETK